MKVSCILFSYNHQNYLADALEGLFTQDYDDIEFIISDDCSQDKSFDIISNYVEKRGYENIVYLDRNEINFGINKHFDFLVSKCTGSLIVLFAGDDISLPNRVSVLVKHALQYDCATAFTSSTTNIDTAGAIVGQSLMESSSISLDAFRSYFSRQPILFNGCAAAYRRSLFDRPIVEHELQSEDIILKYRSLLRTSYICIQEQLVKYRIHDLQSSFKMSEAYYEVLTEALSKEMINEKIIDMKLFSSHLRAGLLHKVKWHLKEKSFLKLIKCLMVLVCLKYYL